MPKDTRRRPGPPKTYGPRTLVAVRIPDEDMPTIQAAANAVGETVAQWCATSALECAKSTLQAIQDADQAGKP